MDRGQEKQDLAAEAKTAIGPASRATYSVYAATASVTINATTAVAIRVRKNLLMMDDAGTAISFQRATIRPGSVCFCAATPVSRRRATHVEKIRNRGDKLRRRERLLQENAVGNAARRPAADRCAGDVDDRKGRVDFPGLLCDLPAIHPALQLHVGHQRAIFQQAALEKRDGLLAGRGDGRFEPAFGKRIFDYYLNVGIVFNDQNQRQLLH
jgi:hypothetical protein